MFDSFPVRIKEYSIEKKLSEGANSYIYLGIKDNEQYALKFPKKVNSSTRSIFINEASKLARFQNENIVNIVDFVEYQDGFFIVLELVKGSTLLSFIRGNRAIPDDIIRDITLDLSSAMIELHSKGIIHRDLKPENLMLDEKGKIKIIDFGFAREEVNESSSKEKHMVGTIAYAAPEQLGLLKRPVDSRSDLYSLGITFYELLTGERPFSASDFESILREIATAPPPAFMRDVEQRFPRLCKVTMDLLSKDPDDRFQSARSVYHNISSREGQLGVPEFKSVQDDSIDFGTLPFFGRKEELSLLSKSLNSSRHARGSFVLIEAEGGKGKSRLVLEAIDRFKSSNSIIFSAKAEYIQSTIPFEFTKKLISSVIKNLELVANNYVLSQLMSQFSSRLKIFLELDYSKEEVSETIDLESSKLILLEEMKQFLFSLSESYNLVLQVDDLQWVDSQSLEFFGKLIGQIDKSQICLISTARFDLNEKSTYNKFLRQYNQQIKRIELGEFGVNDIEELITYYLGERDFDESLVKIVFESSKGNVFFASEYLRSLVFSNVLFFQNEKWQSDKTKLSEIQLSESVFELISSRLQQLSQKALTFYCLGSIIGNRFSSSDCSSILKYNEETLVSVIEEGIDAGLVNARLGGDLYQFSHDRIREYFLQAIDENEIQTRCTELSDFYQNKRERISIFDLARFYSKAKLDESRIRNALHVHLEAGQASLALFDYTNALYYFEFVKKRVNLLTSKIKLISFRESYSIALTESGFEREAIDSIEQGILESDNSRDRLNFNYLKIRAFHSSGRVNEAWTTFKIVAELIGHKYPRYSYLKWCEVNYLIAKLIFKAVFRFGFKSIQLSSKKGIERHTISKILFTAAYAGRFRSRPLDSLVMALRSLDNSYGVNESIYFSSALANLGILLGVYQFKSLSLYLINMSLNGIHQERDGATTAYIRFIQFATYCYLDDKRWLQEIPKLESLVAKYSGAWELTVSTRVSTYQLFLTGNTTLCLSFGTPKIEALENARQHTVLGAFYGDLSCAALVNGLSADAYEYLGRNISITENNVKDINQAVTNLAAVLIFFSLEENEYGSDTDLLIDYFYKLSFDDHFVRMAHVWICYIRLEKYKRAKDINEKKKLRRELKDSLRKLYVRSFIKTFRCHWYIVRAAYCRVNKRLKLASSLLEKGYKEANSVDCKHGLYFATLERARIYRDMGFETRSISEAYGLFSFLSQNDWELRKKNLVSEFQISVSQSGLSTSSSQSISSFDATQTTVSNIKTLQRQRALKALLKIGNASMTTVDLEGQSKVVIEEIVDFFNADRGVIFVDKNEIDESRHKSSDDANDSM